MAAEHAKDRVPVTVKFAFGFAEFGLSLSANFLIFYLLIFLNTVAGLPGTLAGMVLLVGKIVDAVTDPMVGSISDGWKSRWGRRLPFMAVGAPLLALTFLGQLWVPDWAVWAKFGFYVLIGVASQTLYSLVTIPYTSLTAELTQDFEERTSLNGFRQIFSIAGSIAALAIAGIVFSTVKGNDEFQYLIMGVIGAGVIALSLTISVLGIRKFVLGREEFRLANAEAMKEQNGVEENMTYLQQVKVALSNRPFLILCILYLFAWLAVQLTATELTYYLIYWMQIPKAFTPTVILMVMGTALALLAPWSMISHRLGKKGTFLAGGFIWLVAQILLMTLQPGQNTLLYVTAVLAGFGVSVCYLVPWAMLPDVIELDELETGRRREGIFYGFIVFLQKLAVAGALFLAGAVLQHTGFKEKPPLTRVQLGVIRASTYPLSLTPFNGFQAFDTAQQTIQQAVREPATTISFRQPDSALFALRIMVGPTPMVLLLCAMVAAFIFPITKAGHEATLAELKRRRGEHPGDEAAPTVDGELQPPQGPPAPPVQAELTHDPTQQAATTPPAELPTKADPAPAPDEHKPDKGV